MKASLSDWLKSVHPSIPETVLPPPPLPDASDRWRESRADKVGQEKFHISVLPAVCCFLPDNDRNENAATVQQHQIADVKEAAPGAFSAAIINIFLSIIDQMCNMKGVASSDERTIA